MQNPRRRGALAVLTIGLAALGIVAGATQAPPVRAAGNTIRITPATTAVPAAGGTFNVSIVVNASVDTVGAQASVTFDKTKVQITSITRGAPYAAAPLYLGADAAAIATANTKGKLAAASASFLLPGAIGTGDQDFLDIGFRAIACGKVTLALPVGKFDDAVLLDGRAATIGKSIKPTTTGATVQICAPTSSTPTPPGSSSAGATPTPGGSVLAASSAPTDSTPPSSGPTDSALPSVAPSESAGPLAIVASPTPGATQTPTSNTDSGGPPWLLVGLVVVVIVAAGGTLLVRSKRT